ncbi:MAG: VWA domain-containing protein [Burkholderiaceae bacterium]|nr:VWA domain-containing protein [Burkholderiaceae bacterium]
MERNLTRFIRALRSAGADISTAEAIDAAQVLALVGYSDRETMKTSLGVALAKSEEEKVLHDQLFDQFFHAPAPTQAAPRDKSKADSESSEDDSSSSSQGAESSPGGEGEQQSGKSGGGGSDPARARPSPSDLPDLQELAESGDAGRIATAIARAGATVNVDDIRFQSQTAYFVRRMMEQLGLEALETRMLARMREHTPEAQADVEAMIAARSSIQREVRAYVDQRFELFGRSATDAFMNEVAATRAIGALSVRDMERMKAVVAKMAKRLAVRHGRRRRVENRGQLDVRRTLRANAGHDGVPFDIVWKRKHKDRPKIVAICDVSGSVASYVRFLLLFLYALREKVTDLRAFAFSNRLVDIGRILETQSFESAMTRIIDDVGSGSTDYGQALADLQAQHWEVIDRRTTILMLGDGRSNYGDPRLDIIEEATDRAKRLVWLCPEPPSRWGSGDSCMLKYKPFCSPVSHCATATDLEQALDDILLAYD